MKTNLSVRTNRDLVNVPVLAKKKFISTYTANQYLRGCDAIL